MSTFDRVEEHRELVAGLEYEEWWSERRAAADEEMREHFQAAYDLDNPQRSRYFELANEVWEERESR